MSDPYEKELLPLGDSGWFVWRTFGLRTAGLPIAAVDVLADRRLLRAADGPPDAFPAVHATAVQRSSELLRGVAADPLFREAVGWQNPTVVDYCLDKMTNGSPSKVRRRELKVAGYLQRYATKNDTIGFFGPVGWARWTDGPETVGVRPGTGLVRRREVRLELWAVDALAAALSRDPGLTPWLAPRRSPADLLIGSTLHRPRGAPVRLSADDSEVLRLCDGRRTLTEIAGVLAGRPGAAAGSSLQETIDRLSAAGLVRLDIELSWAGEPNQELREILSAVPDTAARDRALARLDELDTARAEVAAAAGDPPELMAALARLDGTFERITGEAAGRRRGEFYAGRRIVYEDTVRDVEVALPTALLEALAPPLSLLLDSARWFVGAVAEAYRRRFLVVFERLRERAGGDCIPFAALLGSVTPDLASWPQRPPAMVAEVVLELQRRWTTILRTPVGARRHAVSAGAVAEAVAAAFPADGPVPWSSAVHHCPDVMIAASSAAAIDRGEFLFVLGELHLAMNTLDSAVMQRLHPDPAQALAVDVQDRGGMRVVALPAKASAAVNSRTYPPAMLSPDYLYWTVHERSTGAPGSVRPVAGMTAHRRGDHLIVRIPDLAEPVDLLEMLGELLSAAAMNGFAPVPVVDHRPRLEIDSLVVARESWRFPVGALDWVREEDAVRRYRGAAAWRAEQGLPRRAFYRVLSEAKPIFLDFAAGPLVELFAATIRRVVEDDDRATVSMTEMLPDVREQWVRDAAGAAYTSELRLVAVDRSRTGR